MIYALHGNLGSVDDWQIAGGFSVDGELEAVDLWEEVKGRSDFEPAGRGWIANVSQAEKHWLLGYSLGGRLALHALLAAPEQWAGAVIISAHPGLRNDDERAEREQRDQVWAEKSLHADWEEFLSEWNAQPVFSENPSPKVLRRQRELEGRREEIAKAFRVWSLGRQEYLGERLAACPVPVLWVTGACDEKFSELGTAMAVVMPDCEHLAISDCGHRVLDEAATELAAAIGDFQKRIL
jgi:2-succinyl-6-hydroxy-2,4-cyclohexadiene-1-carboxylate synthase